MVVVSCIAIDLPVSEELCFIISQSKLVSVGPHRVQTAWQVNGEKSRQIELKYVLEKCDLRCLKVIVQSISF